MNDITGNFSEIFIAKNTYPNAETIFLPLKSLKDIRDDACIVIDTNVLLTPYIIGKDDLLESLKKTYQLLVSQKRLVIPGQVAREFAKNRTTKITELYQQLTRKSVPSMQKGSYPLLSSLKEYEEVIQLEKLIDENLMLYTQKYEKAKKKLLLQIQEWQWNDPVTLLYSQIFNKDVIIDSSMEEEDLLNDFKHRQLHNIPPGYGDRNKDNNNIGDLIIWHTILEIANTRKKSVIFVSGDEKSDWYVRSERTPLYPRYELIDEFRRCSGGETFHIINLSDFLKLFGVNNTIIEEVRKEEQSRLETKEDDLEEYYSKLFFWLGFKYDAGTLGSNKDGTIEIDSGEEDDFTVVANTHVFIDTTIVPENIQNLILEDESKFKAHEANVFVTVIAFTKQEDAKYAIYIINKTAKIGVLNMSKKHVVIIGYFYGLDFNNEFEYPKSLSSPKNR